MTGYDSHTGRRLRSLNGYVVEVVPNDALPGQWNGVLNGRIVCVASTQKEAERQARRIAKAGRVPRTTTPERKNVT